MNTTDVCLSITLYKLDSDEPINDELRDDEVGCGEWLAANSAIARRVVASQPIHHRINHSLQIQPIVPFTTPLRRRILRATCEIIQLIRPLDVKEALSEINGVSL